MGRALVGTPLTLSRHHPCVRAEPEEVLVYDTDYRVFALMLFRRQSGRQSVLRVNLLCESPAQWPRSSWWEQEGEGRVPSTAQHCPLALRG